MNAPSLDLYVAGFLARCEAGRQPGQVDVDEPGVRGVAAGADVPSARLLVTDDRACDLVAALLADAHAGTVTVLAPAQRCCELIDGYPAWRKSATTTAMVRADLRSLPVRALPSPLCRRRVRRLPSDAPDGVPLGVVAEAAMRADPRIVGPAAAFERYLHRLPGTVQLFAAVDPDGAVRATSGCHVTAAAAGVFFVNTVPEWRGLGIGQAMTAIALDAARKQGARYASLNATSAGRRIYDRLGFAAVTQATRFTGAEPS